METRNRGQGTKTQTGAGKSIALALLVMAAVSGLLLLLLAALLYRLEVGEAFLRIGVIAVYALSGVAGGFLCGKLRGEKKFIWGLAAGMLYFAALLLTSVALRGDDPLDMARVVTALGVCAGSGMVGGMLS